MSECTNLTHFENHKAAVEVTSAALSHSKQDAVADNYKTVVENYQTVVEDYQTVVERSRNHRNKKR